MITIDFKQRKILGKLSHEHLRLCTQCATCSGVCVWNDFRYFNPRSMIHQGQLGLWDIEAEEIWLCSTCALCEQQCPRGVKITAIMVALRNMALEDGRNVPVTLTRALDSLYEHHNPLMCPKQERTQWSRDLNVKTINAGESAEVLYFVGCTASYDPRAQKIARALVKTFNHLQIDFAILGNAERDCGNCLRMLGEDMHYALIKEEQGALINSLKINHIVTTSPHSYHTHKDYDLRKDIRIQHYTEFLWEKIQDGSLKFPQSLRKTVTYQDPCFLGRHNNIYQPPRQVLKAIPGLKFVEMERNKKFAMCCGGGGGLIWHELKPEHRFSLARVKEAVATGADTLATACYFCLLMLEDAVTALGMQETLQVRDIAELVAEAIGESN